MKEMQELLELTVKEGASDLHLSAGHPPVMRIARKLIPLVRREVLNSDQIQTLLSDLMSEEQKARLEEERQVDFSYAFKDTARFRINVFYQSQSVSAALRRIPQKIQTIEELNLPSVIHRLTEVNQGFVLVTGPSGQGKSTTLAAMIEEINQNRTAHIITIEDPIEYIFDDKQSIIDQREVYRDTPDFTSALRETFRLDPDVIMVLEMRD